jgi:16S rRNA (adenine1518-N6/adenine1519-N6)-dimethyltransferase
MESNIKPNKKLGQNFLINKYTINTILEILDIKNNDYVIEIGPGKGALTKHIINKTKNYVGVEKDKNLCDFLKNKYKNKINIINEDILKTDFNNIFNKKYRIIGNIPYNISTKLITKCVENRKNIYTIHLMMQKEFTDRVISNYGKKSYGRLSVLSQIFFKIEKYIDIEPSDFYPKPKIYSSFLSLTPIKNIIINDVELDDFLNFVKKIFSTRRKKIKNCININSEDLYDNINKRAEELSISEMIKLYRDIKNDGKFI